MQRIVVVGAGFSGAATVIHLLRRHGDRPLAVTLVSRHPELGRGIAYGTHSPWHLLNVPAGRMSLFPGDEGDFLRFAQERDPTVTGGSFLPRSLYGEYLAARLQEAGSHTRRARFSALSADVDDLHVTPKGHVQLSLAGGGILQADRVVIASGNHPPADPCLPDMVFYQHPRYVRDPWGAGALDGVDGRQPVLLIGSGLTMMDVVLELERRGLASRLHAISRRGLLPLAHRPHTGGPLEPTVIMDMLRRGRPSVRGWLRALRLCAADLAEQGIDWRDVIGAIRPFTAELWQSLDLSERRRFLRHVQAYWDSHRHRTAPQPHAVLQQLLKEGRLTVQAGRLLGLKLLDHTQIKVSWRSRHAQQERYLRVGTVINCTGPQNQVTGSTDQLLASLLRQGLMVPDALGLGVQVDKLGALLDRDGAASELLFYTGPLLKARDWECTAVPELRVAALKLAEHLAASTPVRRVAEVETV